MRIVGGIEGFLGFVVAGTAQAASAGPSVLTPITLAVGVDHSVKIDTVAGIREKVDQAFNLLSTGRQALAVKMFDQVIETVDRSLAGDARPRLCSKAAEQKGASTSRSVIVDSALCDAHFGKGFALIDLGRGDLAEAELYKATQMAPNDAHYANEYAELFKSRREWQKSYDLFAHAWAIADKDVAGADASLAARALRGMGYSKLELGQLADAEKLFRLSLDYEPGNEAAKGELGYLARKVAIGS